MRLLAFAFIAASWCGACLIDTSGLSGGAVPLDGGGAVEASPNATADASSVDAADAASCPSDLTSDPKNCGACGHDCLGGGCTKSQCEPVVMVQGQGDVAGVAVDETGIYFTSFEGVLHASALDGTAVRALGNLGACDDLAIDDTYLYAATVSVQTIVRLKKDGTSATPEMLATCNGQCLGVTLRNGVVYFTDRGGDAGSNTFRMIGTGGVVTDVINTLNQPEGVSVGASEFLIANENNNEIVGVPFGGTTGTTVVSVTDPVSVVEDEPNLWVVSQTPRQIVKIPIGGNTSTIVATTTDQPVGLAQTATAIYWGQANGTVMRLAK